MNISDWTDKLATLRRRHAAAVAVAANAHTAWVNAQGEAEATTTALAVARDIAQATQQQAHARIAATVSRCLATIFPDPYEFTITFEQKRGRTEAVLAFQRGGHTVSPTRGAGGGAADVAAFALRLACIMLAQPTRRRLLVLDEPMKWVSAEYRPAVRAMLEALAAELQVQIIMVTHEPEFICGTVVELG